MKKMLTLTLLAGTGLISCSSSDSGISEQQEQQRLRQEIQDEQLKKACPVANPWHLGLNLVGTTAIAVSWWKTGMSDSTKNAAYATTASWLTWALDNRHNAKTTSTANNAETKTTANNAKTTFTANNEETKTTQK